MHLHPTDSQTLPKSAGNQSVSFVLEQKPQAQQKRPRIIVCILTAVISVIVYALVAVLVWYLTKNSGQYPSGSDTMFYVYRGDFLYRSITQDGNWYPLLDPQWYNGVQTFRYWSPLSAYILAGFQALAGGDSFEGYVLFVSVFYFLNAIVWLIIGIAHGRPIMGAFIGLIWFFVPNNVFMLYTEGVVARAQSMVVLPIFAVALHDYMTKMRWGCIPLMMVSFYFVVMSHTGWAGMVAITVAIYLFIFCIANRKSKCPQGRGSALVVLLSMASMFLVAGVWMYASLQGGITGTDSSSIMETYFQSLNLTLNPLYGIEKGLLNRWDDPVASSGAYFGIAAFVLAAFGLLFSNRKTVPAFATVLIIVLLTSNGAYPFLAVLPGGQYLWMLRFLSIALTFLLMAFFMWKSLRRSLQIVFSCLLVLECAAALSVIANDQSGEAPYERYDTIEQNTLIGEGKKLATQRLSAVEPYSSIIDGIYVIAGYGDDAVPTSYGQGVQSAATYRNIVQLNQSAEDGSFLYMFDRALELGNDVVLVPVCNYAADKRSEVVDKLDAAAERVGYELADENDSYRLYRYDAPETFGVTSEFTAIGIGTSAPLVSLAFPAVKETESINLNDYTFEELSQYEEVVLSGFTYNDKAAAEDLVRQLSETGVHVVIMADGIPDEEHTGTKTFLGMDCESIEFKNGFPELETKNGTLYCDLFPSDYSRWKTVYVNGLDEVWGTIEEDGRDLAFYGTVENDNITVIGLNLTFFYSLTQDEQIEELLSDAFKVSETDLPKRKAVPIEITYENDSITIKSPSNDTNTTLAFHDIFSSGKDIWSDNYLLHVNSGTTTIKLTYPYLMQGLLMSGFGIFCSVVLLTGTRIKASRKRKQLNKSPETHKDVETIVFN